MVRSCLTSCLLALCLPLIGSCDPPIPAEGNPDMATYMPRHLDPALAWWGDNRKRLDAFLDAHGKGSAGYDANKKPIALFDWDNTIIKNDVGDITLFWMLKMNKIFQPPDKNWRRTSFIMTPNGLAALKACDSLANPGEVLPTGKPEGVACADAILSVYLDNKGTSGLAAFGGYDYRRMEPTYALSLIHI